MPSAKSNTSTKSTEDSETVDTTQSSLEGVTSAGNGDITNKGMSATSETVASQQQQQQHLQEAASLEDPLCSARTAQKVTFQDVTTASFLNKGGVEYTPCPVSGNNIINYVTYLQLCIRIEALSIVRRTGYGHLPEEGVSAVHRQVRYNIIVLEYMLLTQLQNEWHIYQYVYLCICALSNCLCKYFGSGVDNICR